MVVRVFVILTTNKTTQESNDQEPRDEFTAGKNCQENMSKGSNFQDYCRLIVGRVVVG